VEKEKGGRMNSIGILATGIFIGIFVGIWIASFIVELGERRRAQNAS
jgi:hypothetical protein